MAENQTDGRVELLQAPIGMLDGRVRLISIADDSPKLPACLLTFGRYQSGATSTHEDFKDAEWHRDKEFDGPLPNEYVLDSHALVWFLNSCCLPYVLTSFIRPTTYTPSHRCSLLKPATTYHW
jgi:hypothetical protein